MTRSVRTSYFRLDRRQRDGSVLMLKRPGYPQLNSLKVKPQPEIVKQMGRGAGMKGEVVPDCPLTMLGRAWPGAKLMRESSLLMML